VTVQIALLMLLGWLWNGSAAAEEISFGPIQVASSMGDPLHVEIPLQAASDKPLKNMEALWGVPTDYTHQGGPALAVVAKRENGKDVLLVESDQRMTIPFFTILIKVVADDHILLRNFPVWLGEHVGGTAAKLADPSVGASTDTVASPPAESPPGKNVVLWLTMLILLSGGVFVFWKSRQRIPRGVISRGLARKRPMATPVTVRETAIPDRDPTISGRASPYEPDTSGIRLIESESQVPTGGDNSPAAHEQPLPPHHFPIAEGAGLDPIDSPVGPIVTAIPSEPTNPEHIGFTSRNTPEPSATKAVKGVTIRSVTRKKTASGPNREKTEE